MKEQYAEWLCHSLDRLSDRLLSHEPLTKRDQFAMAAMQGMLAADPSHVMHRSLAVWSVSQADALLAELEKNADEGTEA